MDRDLYKIMTELKENKGNNNSEIKYVGTFLIDEETSTRKCSDCEGYYCYD